MNGFKEKERRKGMDKGAVEMSGKIDVIIEKGKPRIKNGRQLRPDLIYYPYWSLEVTDRNNSKIKSIVTPSYLELKKVLKEILVHELRVDVAIGKRNEFKKYKEFFSPEYVEEAQRKITEYGLPELYRKCKK